MMPKEPSDWQSVRELYRMGRKEGLSRFDMLKIIFWTEAYLLKDRLLGEEPLTDEEMRNPE